MMLQNYKLARLKGSALILTMILTVLLAVIGVTFLMVSRIDEAVTSNISQDKELKSAVDNVIGTISRQLVLDTPGVAGQEYYDYPGSKDPWLASIEPYSTNYKADETNTYWSQISDVTGYLKREGINTHSVIVNPKEYSSDPKYKDLYNRKVIKEYPKLMIDENGNLDHGHKLSVDSFVGQFADADGDGIADSKWIELDGVKTDKGKPIYAAIRVIDNCGMVNVNTAIACDSEAKFPKMVDGSSLTQIDLAGLVGRDNSQGVTEILENEATSSRATSLSYLIKGWDIASKSGGLKIPGRYTNSNLEVFADKNSSWWTTVKHNWWEDIGNPDSDGFNGIDYIDDYFAWRWGQDANRSMRFDISDELALRERFCVKRNSMSRLESLWPWRYTKNPNGVLEKGDADLGPQRGIYDATTGSGLSDWISRMADVRRITNPNSEPKFVDADKRHWLTTYSFDRIIDPDGRKQMSLNIDISRQAGRLDQYDYPRRDFNNVSDRVNRSEMMARALYLTFVKSLSKNREDLGNGKKPNLISRAELRKLGQLAVNIVDQRDKDVDITRLSLALPNFLHSEFEYLYSNMTDGDGWFDKDDDLGLDNPYFANSFDPNAVVYGIEPHPVISGVAVHYDPFKGDPNTADWKNDPTVWSDAHAKYAIELYNPYDFTLYLPVNDNYKLVFWDRSKDTPFKSISISNNARIVDIAPRSFRVLTNDSGFWKGSGWVKDADSVISPVNMNVSFSEAITHTDKEIGYTQRTISNYAVQTPCDILLSKDVDGEEIYLDHYTVDPNTVYWDVENANAVLKYQQRLTNTLEASPIVKNNLQRSQLDSLSLFERQNRWWDFVNPRTAYSVKYSPDTGAPNGFIASEKDLSVKTHRFTIFDPSMVTQRWMETVGSLPPSDTLYESDYIRGDLKGLNAVEDYIEKKSKGYWNRPIVKFTTVGDISRIWTVGPQRWEIVEDRMEVMARDYRTLIDNEFASDIDPRSYDPDNGEYINLYPKIDPVDPNNYLDWESYALTAGDYISVLEHTGREDYMRLDLRNPRFSNIFQYVTAFDPSRDYIDNDGDGVADPGFDTTPDSWKFKSEDRSEWKIPGRINVNTAPWYVIAQLPWVKVNGDNPNIIKSFDDPDQYKLAAAICAYRDKRNANVFGLGGDIPDYQGDDGRYDVMKKVLKSANRDDVREEKGFASIGELSLVVNSSGNEYCIDKLGNDNKDVKYLPDLITYVDEDLATIDPNDVNLAGDNAVDDFEEKDLIFSRLSNLATVRSDTFTAYILVRLGSDGPQKRVVAILDRSNVYPVYDNNGKNLSREAVDNNKPPKVVGRVKIVGYKQIGDVTY